MTLEQMNEFQQWYEKVLTRTSNDKKQYPEWYKNENGWEPFIPISLLLELSDEKVEELRTLYKKYS